MSCAEVTVPVVTRTETLGYTVVSRSTKARADCDSPTLAAVEPDQGAVRARPGGDTAPFVEPGRVFLSLTEAAAATAC